MRRTGDDKMDEQKNTRSSFLVCLAILLAVVVIGSGVYYLCSRPNDNHVSDTVQRVEMGADSVGAKLDEVGEALDRGQVEISGAEDTAGELQGSLDARTDLIDQCQQGLDRIKDILADIEKRNGINGTQADGQGTAE